MAAFDPSADILESYPKKNPFVFNAYPMISSEKHPIPDINTPEFLQAALSIAVATNGYNVCSTMYGSNPFPIDAEAVNVARRPIQLPEGPPEVPEVEMPTPFVFLDEVTREIPAFAVSAESWDAPRLLKVYPIRHDMPGSLQQYHNEVDAYAHLLHYGACKRGSVPQCFGRVTLSPAQMMQILAMPSLSAFTRTVLHNAESFGALLLEHIPQGRAFTIENISEKVSQRVLNALYDVHTCYVRHGALSSANVLFYEYMRPLPPDHWLSDVDKREFRYTRAVWFNFRNASCLKTASLSGLDLYRELGQGWELFYRHLLPAKRIGYAKTFSLRMQPVADHTSFTE